ncbi:DsrE family protein [Caenispirillum salinarum]|uniref:DsrE family protein n=1 Tax=Caenispirillum salinarum TaxID=859058 RepID=UPI00384ACE98
MIRFTDFVAVARATPADARALGLAATAAVAAQARGTSASLVLVADAAAFARPGALKGMDPGPPFRPLPELVDELRASGGQVCVSAVCLVKEDIAPDRVAEGMTIITIDEMVDLLMRAKGTLQLT